VNIGASVRQLYETRRRSTCQSAMSSSTSAHPSMPILAKKNSSSTSGMNLMKQRATSANDMDPSLSTTLKRDSSSGFNYQTLPDSTPLHVRRYQSKSAVRSHSSSNDEIIYHVQQMKHVNKCKTTCHHDENINLTASNLNITCNEIGKETTMKSTIVVQTTESNIDVPVSWKPAIQHTVIQRDSWDHKIEFLLAIIGYAVDLGRHQLFIHANK
jgi:hypothetical protein